MKQKDFLRIALLFFMLIGTNSSFGQVFITETADPNDNGGARYVEIFNQGNTSVDLSTWKLRRWTNESVTPQADEDLSETIPSKGFVVFAANITSFNTAYPTFSGTVVQLGTSGPADSNGDDNIALIDNNGDIVDIFGLPGEDGSGTCHEFENGRAERKSTVLTGKSTWSEADWNVWADSTVSGCTSHTNDPQNAADGDFDPGSWIGDSSSASPGITLGAVSNNTNENGTTATFTVVLDAEPTANVVLDISSGDTDEVTVTPSTLTFTNVNWDTAQTITATGVDDALIDGNVDVIITIAVDDINSDDAYDSVPDVTATITNEDNDLPNIVISEIMYNTPTIYGSDDEWIELHNANGGDVDISGWTLEYNSITFTFPGATNFSNGGYIVIAVGSNGDGTFNGDNPFTPDFNNLSVANTAVKDTDNSNNLTNSTRTIELKNGTFTIDNVTYNSTNISSTDGNGSSYEIISNLADNSATNLNWQASAINGGSPKRISGSIWTGNSNSDWTDGANWTNTRVPVSSSDALIRSSLTNYPNSAGVVTINKVLIESGATLIATNTFTTTSATYKRTLANANQWYYMSSPVVGEIYNDSWVLANSVASGQFNNRGISTYDNTSFDTNTGAGDTETGYWRYLQATGSDNFNVGQGYGVYLSAPNTVTFSGTGIYTSDQTFSMTQGENNFNLVGNPFTAFVTLGTFHTTNTANIDTDFYFWNGSSYTTLTSGSDATYEIAPGKGFFVDATSAANVTFEIADASHQSTDSFEKTANTRPEINITVKKDTKESFARFLYIDGTTKGYDKGYDGKLFGGVSHSFVIYSDLIESDGKKYQSQSLPNSDYENMMIPIGVIVEANKEITFSAEVLNLPADINVYLEDRFTNTFTRLDEANSSYKITSDVALDGVGRFYLHTKSSSALSVDTVNMDNISIYKTNNTNLRIAGLSQGKASIKLFTMLGKQVFENSFISNGVQDITLPSLSTGIYIVQLETETGSLNKKITLE
jgi:hypothetical protein